MLRRSKKRTRCLSESPSRPDSPTAMIRQKLKAEGVTDLMESESESVEDLQPSTVEALVLRCAECFGEIKNYIVLMYIVVDAANYA